ncbi:hypothetical protein [Mangrovicella endophytica]|uniref:hypothetical protein n=1 Tax=Mangrovicella endophytica TaxID=2066697 RepID=UPI0018E47896|nr:hypothetical protein [Mangrovicella endophytica]
MTERPRMRGVAAGEAMLEMAPVGNGLYRGGFAGDTFNTAWHMAQLLGSRVGVGLVTGTGRDTLSDHFVTEAVASGEKRSVDLIRHHSARAPRAIVPGREE